MELIERREEGETWEEWGEDIRSVEKGTSLAHLCALGAAEACKTKTTIMILSIGDTVCNVRPRLCVSA